MLSISLGQLAGHVGTKLAGPISLVSGKLYLVSTKKTKICSATRRQLEDRALTGFGILANPVGNLPRADRRLRVIKGTVASSMLN